MCFFLILLMSISFIYAFFINFLLLHRYKLRVASCLIRKNNLIKRFLIGILPSIISSLIFSFLFLLTLLDLSFNFKTPWVIFIFLNFLLLITFYTLYSRKIEEETSDFVSDYVFTFWVPTLVALLLSLPFTLYLLHTTPVKEVIPTTDVLAYVYYLLNHFPLSLKECQFLSFLSVLFKLEEYLLWVATIGFKKLGMLPLLIAILIQLIKSGISIWTLNRLIIGTIIILRREKRI